jgi:hypothetical protein
MEMFCPKCSQPQVSDDVRFCSRCGFQMHVVAHLLETNGALAAFEAEEPETPSLYRRITSSAGAKVMFVSVVLFIFFLIFAAINDAPEVMLVPFFLFVIGAAMLVYKLIFGGKTSAGKTEESSYKTKNLNRAESPNKLSPAQSEPISFYESPRRKTGELRQPPPSVTEPTTKLLEPDSGKTNDL